VDGVEFGACGARGFIEHQFGQRGHGVCDGRQWCALFAVEYRQSLQRQVAHDAQGRRHVVAVRTQRLPGLAQRSSVRHTRRQPVAFGLVAAPDALHEPAVVGVGRTNASARHHNFV
jgi:hypothetical protein